MKSYIDEVLKILRKKIICNERTIIFLEAGHFKTSKVIDNFAISSLSDATLIGETLIKEFNKKVKIVFGVLADDLGMECGLKQCSINNLNLPDKTITLPKEITEVLQKCPYVKIDKVLLSSERGSKNRCIKYLKKLLKNTSSLIVKENEDDYTNLFFYNKDSEKTLLAKKKGHLFNAYCSSILGQHYADTLLKLQERFFENFYFVILDWNEMFEISRVSSGVSAFQKVFYKIPTKKYDLSIINIFLGDDEGDVNRIQESNNQMLNL